MCRLTAVQKGESERGWAARCARTTEIDATGFYNPVFLSRKRTDALTSFSPRTLANSACSPSASDRDCLFGSPVTSPRMILRPVPSRIGAVVAGRSLGQGIRPIRSVISLPAVVPTPNLDGVIVGHGNRRGPLEGTAGDHWGYVGQPTAVRGSWERLHLAGRPSFCALFCNAFVRCWPISEAKCCIAATDVRPRVRAHNRPVTALPAGRVE
jgi:hypothetical protein